MTQPENDAQESIAHAGHDHKERCLSTCIDVTTCTGIAAREFMEQEVDLRAARSDGFRAGLEAAAKMADKYGEEVYPYRSVRGIAAAIRALPVPEDGKKP
jgi:hypothetical protein